MSISRSVALRRASSQMVGLALSLATLSLPILPNLAHAQTYAPKAATQLAPSPNSQSGVIALPPTWGPSAKPTDKDAGMARFAQLAQQLTGASEMQSLPPELRAAVEAVQPNLNWLISQPDAFGPRNISALISGCGTYFAPAQALFSLGTAGITDQSALMAKLDANLSAHQQFFVTASLATMRCIAQQLSDGPGIFPTFPDDASRPKRLDGMRSMGSGLGRMISGLITLSPYMSREEQIFALTVLDKELGSLAVILTPEGRAIVDKSLAQRLTLPVTSDHGDVRTLLAKLRARFSEARCALCQREGLPD